MSHISNQNGVCWHERVIHDTHREEVVLQSGDRHTADVTSRWLIVANLLLIQRSDSLLLIGVAEQHHVVLLCTCVINLAIQSLEQVNGQVSTCCCDGSTSSTQFQDTASLVSRVHSGGLCIPALQEGVLNIASNLLQADGGLPIQLVYRVRVLTEQSQTAHLASVGLLYIGSTNGFMENLAHIELLSVTGNVGWVRCSQGSLFRDCWLCACRHIVVLPDNKLCIVGGSTAIVNTANHGEKRSFHLCGSNQLTCIIRAIPTCHNTIFSSHILIVLSY